MLSASAVVLVHIVLAGVAREDKSSVAFGVGLGSEGGRKGLEGGVFSLVSVVSS